MKRKFEEGNILYTSIKVLKCIPQKLKQKFLMQIILVTLSSIGEVITLALVSASITTLSGGSLDIGESSIAKINERIAITNFSFNAEYMLCITILVIILSSLLRLSVAYKERNLVINIGSTLSSYAYRNILDRDFAYFLNRASSYVISNMTTHSGDTALYSYWTIQLLTTFILSCLLVATSMTLNTVITILLVLGCASYYLLYARKTRLAVEEASKSLYIYNQRVINEIQEATGSITDLKLGGLELYYMDRYTGIDRRLRKAQTFSTFSSTRAKVLIEFISYLVITSIVFLAALGIVGGITSQKLLLIGLMWLRLVPNASNMFNIYSKMSCISASVGSFVEIASADYGLISQNIEKKRFEESILLNNIWFKYEDSEHYVLSGFSCEIKKGRTTLIDGISGRGKTTLINIATGLLIPTRGEVLVDGEDINSLNQTRSWQSQISYISQRSYIFNGTMLDNVCLKSSKPINHEMVKYALEIARLEEFIRHVEKGEWSNVGENGCKLSAGQRQRLLIARVVYNKKDILILDEATSMLDKTVESDVIRNLQAIYSTMLIVSHDPSLRSFCQSVIKL
jgi:ABC-type multidrug transport system fused ATPase/permease subunit